MIPEITALIPTFKRPKLLRRAINSVLNQSYGNVKVKIFDDASNDETQDVVLKMQQRDKRISYHRHAENIGFLKNWKLVFTNVDSPYFSVLGDDDFLLPNFYEKAVNVLEANKEIDFVIMDTLSVDVDMNLVVDLDNSNNLVIYNDDNRFDRWISGEIPKKWHAILFRREVANAYLDMDPQNIDVGHDIRFLMRAITRHKFAYLSLPGACYLYWDGNLTTEIYEPVDYLHEAAQISRLLEIYGDQNVSAKTKEKIPEIIKDHFQGHIFINSLRIMLPRILRSHVFNEEKDRLPLRKAINFYKKKGYKKTALALRFYLDNKLIQVSIYYLLGPIAKKVLNRRKEKMADIKKKKFSKEFHAIEKIMRDQD